MTNKYKQIPFAIMAIPLTKGKFTLVDGEDYIWLSQWKWYAQKSKYTSYAARTQYGSHAKGWRGKVTKIDISREIMHPPSELVVDHINGNGLDNRKRNLRICTQSENCKNKHR